MAYTTRTSEIINLQGLLGHFIHLYSIWTAADCTNSHTLLYQLELCLNSVIVDVLINVFGR